jgi:glutamine---fructose-6-phosphate transaminase (isomerizing)
MAKETAEVPDVVARVLTANAAELHEIGRLFRRIKPSHFVTCARGSSDFAAGYLGYLLELFLGTPCCSLGPSVVSVYRASLKLRDAISVTISQSGRSPDLLAFQTEARRAGIPTIVITNDVGSPLAEDATVCLDLHAGPEFSVPATKTFIASVALAAAIVDECDDGHRLRQALGRLPGDLLKASGLCWMDVETALCSARSLYVLARGPCLPMAQEAALKLKETSGLHAEAFSSAEVMHGPIEIVEQGFPILLLAPEDPAWSATQASLASLQAAGAHILQPGFHRTLDRALDPISMIQSFYGAAERLARMRGRDPDRPRLLQKVMRTV